MRGVAALFLCMVTREMYEVNQKYSAKEKTAHHLDSPSSIQKTAYKRLRPR